MHGGVAYLTMHLNRSQRGLGGISFVWEAHADAGTSNVQLTVEADDCELALSGATDGYGFGAPGEEDPANGGKTALEGLMTKAGIELAKLTLVSRSRTKL